MRPFYKPIFAAPLLLIALLAGSPAILHALVTCDCPDTLSFDDSATVVKACLSLKKPNADMLQWSPELARDESLNHREVHFSVDYEFSAGGEVIAQTETDEHGCFAVTKEFPVNRVIKLSVQGPKPRPSYEWYAVGQCRVLLDRDRDGMADAWELKFGLDAYSDDSAIDENGDGLTNLQHYRAGTVPTPSIMQRPAIPPFLLEEVNYRQFFPRDTQANSVKIVYDMFGDKTWGLLLGAIQNSKKEQRVHGVYGAMHIQYLKFDGKRLLPIATMILPDHEGPPRFQDDGGIDLNGDRVKEIIFSTAEGGAAGMGTIYLAEFKADRISLMEMESSNGRTRDASLTGYGSSGYAVQYGISEDIPTRSYRIWEIIWNQGKRSLNVYKWGASKYVQSDVPFAGIERTPNLLAPSLWRHVDIQ